MESSPAPSAPPASSDNPKSAGNEYVGILSRWKREDWLKRGSLASRGLGLLFSLLAFLIMATNSHGGWMDFDKYDEYRYVLAIAILSSLYTGGQSLRKFHEFYTGRESFNRRSLALFDFFGDQFVSKIYTKTSYTQHDIEAEMVEVPSSSQTVRRQECICADDGLWVVTARTVSCTSRSRRRSRHLESLKLKGKPRGEEGVVERWRH